VNRLWWWLQNRQAALALGFGLVLIAASLALHGLATKPLERRVEALQDQRKGVRDEKIDRLAEDMGRQNSPDAQLASFYRHFAGDELLTDRLARVHAIARGLGLEIKRAEYRLTSQPERKLDRYQMIVPLQGNYPALRSFVTTVLSELPTLSLDHMQVQRDTVAEGAVQTQISFTFYIPK
jgi:hypothetical protein